MSKLEELLQTFCSDDVLSCTFGQVVNYEQPSKYIVKSTDYNNEYETPVLTAGQTFILGYTNETEGIYNASKDSPVIIFDDFTGAFKWVDFRFKVKSSAMKILTADETKVTLRYIYHMMGKIAFTSDEHKRLWIGTYSTFKFPLPPLPIQTEIVRILDNFTQLTAELTAELEARKKQYEYYSIGLFEHLKKQSDIYPLSKLGKWSGGKTPSMANTEFWTNGTIPWISSKDMKTSCMANTEDHITTKALSDASMTLYPAGCTAVVTRSGILKHTFPVSYIPFETTVNQDIKILVPNQNVLPRYAYLVISAYSEEIRTTTKKQGGTVDSLDFNKVLNFKVPVPPLTEQERIVSILDRFDTLCNDISEGLPAEIEARQKQYEYYRDKLLSFKEL